MSLQLAKDVKYTTPEMFLSRDKHKLFMAFGHAARQLILGEISFPSSGQFRLQDMLMIVRAGKAAEVQQLRIDADKKAAVKDLMVQAPIGVKAAMDMSMNELSKLHGLSADDMTAEVILDLTAQHAGTGGSMMTPRRGTNRTARWSEVNALFESE